MSFVDEEIASQPECWNAAVELLQRDGSLDLPEPGERLAVVGCGTSSFVAQAYAARREAAGQGWSDAFAASEYPESRQYDAVIVLSRSGTTTEAVRFLDRLHERTAAQPPRTLAVTTDAESPLAQRATHRVVLSMATERSVLQTRWATTALALLRAALGEELAGMIPEAEQAVAEPFPARPDAYEHLAFLGRGWTVGLANEAALKCREAAGFWTESHSAMEYRHGPISAVTGNTLVWSLGPVPAGLDREVAELGGRLVASDLDPMAELIRIQRYAVALARAAGQDPDRPRGLSYSVLLPDHDDPVA